MRITFIGSGHVATHLAAAFRNEGHVIVQVYSRDEQHAAMLAYHVGAEPISQLKNLNPETELIIISVNDDAIVDVAENMPETTAMVVHTSGSTPLFILERFPQHGVLYPLQTFSKTVSVNMQTVPLCIEANSSDALYTLKKTAAEISHTVEEVDSNKRRILHLSAVFACNFVNHLYGIGQHLLAQNQLDFSLLRPLILQTAEKVMEALPGDVQTGPAVRNDRQTINRHLDLLKDEKSLSNLYQLISEGIFEEAQNRLAGG